MFLNQSVYYFDGVDNFPVQIVKCSPKMVWIDLGEKTKRVKKSSCHYQETDGGFICVDRLERLMLTNSQKMPEKFIIQDDLASFQGVGIIRERKAINQDYALYPQVVDKQYIRWSLWTDKSEKGK